MSSGTEVDRTVTYGAASSFGERVETAFSERGRFCVGIDPHSWLLGEWGLPDTASGAESFGRTVVEAASGVAGIVKPQVAFFERFGAEGYLALERVLADAREAGLLVIADGKRGDLGTSVAAYGDAWLSPGSPLEADALTVHAYLGVASLLSVIAQAEHNGKGLFILAATSNPEGAQLQGSVVATGPRAGMSVAAGILADVAEHNAQVALAKQTTQLRFGSIGVVLGATLDLAQFGINVSGDVDGAPAAALTPVLAPGFGHQGAEVRELGAIFGRYAPGVIVSESRSVLSAGPNRLRQAIARRIDEVTEAGADHGE